MSTIATNISAGHFMGMAGSAYLFGLAQANLEINAIFGILMAAFVFVPLFLRSRVTTVAQFFEEKLGSRVAVAYSLLMIVLYVVRGHLQASPEAGGQRPPGGGGRQARHPRHVPHWGRVRVRHAERQVR
ncbi:MAG: hypothetical protein JRS35_27060 [Deltaproteobacteria bacterium]|nr:hypothetical protein [Deltaproteobacteria bacterium]